MEKTKRNKKGFELDAKTRKLFDELGEKFLWGCVGKSMSKIGMLMSAFSCATLESACRIAGIDPSEYLHDNAQMLLEGIESYYSKPDNAA